MLFTKKKKNPLCAAPSMLKKPSAAVCRCQGTHANLFSSSHCFQLPVMASSSSSSVVFQKPPEPSRFSRSYLLPHYPLGDGVHRKLGLTENVSFKELDKMDEPEFKAEICDPTLPQSETIVALWRAGHR